MRLLGKLGGKNRQFLRDPMLLYEANSLSTKSEITIACSWGRSKDAMELDGGRVLPLPLSQCVEILRTMAMAHPTDEKSETESEGGDAIIHRTESSHLWDCRIEDLDIASYSKEVIDTAKQDHAMASMAIICTAINVTIDRISSDTNEDKNARRCFSDEKLICMGLLYACMVDGTKEEAWVFLKDLVVQVDHGTLAASLSSLLSEPSSLATKVGLDFLGFLLDRKDSRGSDVDSSLFDALVCSLCETCCSCSWGRQVGPQEAICKMTATLGSEWSQKYEVKLVNAVLLPVKTVPRELAEAAVEALRVFIIVCSTLYGEQWSRVNVEDTTWDFFCSDEEPEKRLSEKIVALDSTANVSEAKPRCIRPSEDVFKITVYELTSPQQLVR